MSKQIILKRLKLHNFKGAKNLTVEFHADRPTTISGRNGSGKTTIMDAFMWLLWGLNAEQQQTSKFGIKPNNPDGTTRLDLDTEVEGAIQITDTNTGETTDLTVMRRWVSIWKTKSGEVEKEYNGNKGEYFINGVPVKESEYNATISGVIPPEIFKVITNPYYFPNLPWQKRREILLGMTENVTYEDVAKAHAEFAKFLRDLSGKSVDTFNDEINAAINRINKRLDDIPNRIDENERSKPLTPDYEALKKERAEAEKEMAEINATLAASSESAKIREDARTETISKQGELRRRQREIIDSAQHTAWEATRAANAKREQLLQEQRNEESRWMTNDNIIRMRATIAQQDFDTNEAEAVRLEKEQEKLRKEWYDENEKTYTSGGNLVCPITKQFCTDPNACYEHKQHEYNARQAFIENQRNALEDITERGQKLGGQIADLRAKAAEADKRLKALRKEYADAKKKHDSAATRIADELAKHPEQKSTTIEGKDIPEWVAINAEIEKLQQELDNNKPEETTLSGAVSLRQKTLADRMAEIDRKLGLQTIIEQMENRIKELQQEEKNLLQERASLQKQQKIIERLTKARMTELEKRINCRFKLVRFEMFEPTATTGDEKPNCVCWVGEAKYNDKNRAGKVHAGLDIINALCAYHHITAPVFIDNAEGVNEFIPTESQLVLLKTTTEDFQVE